MGKVRHDALPEKGTEHFQNLWEQAETVLRMNNNKGNATIRRYKAAEHRFCDFMSERYQTKISRIWKHDTACLCHNAYRNRSYAQVYSQSWLPFDFFHKRLGSKNKLPTNKQLGIMPNDDYKYNRAFCRANLRI